MTASCQPLPHPVAEEMLQLVARALCDRTGESPAQRDARTRHMVLSSLGFAPRDGLEFILATLTFGHFQLLLDAMHDILVSENGVSKARTRSAVVSLNRSMMHLLRELRQAGSRPSASGADIAKLPGEAIAAEPVAPARQVVAAEDSPPMRPGIPAVKQSPAEAPKRTVHPAASPMVSPVPSPIAWPANPPNHNDDYDEAALLRRIAATDKLLASYALLNESNAIDLPEEDELAGDAD